MGGIPGLPALPMNRLPEADDPRLRRLERLGYLLDESIRLPGGYRIGYDAFIGLVPGVGDLAGLALSAYIVAEAARYGLPTATLVRMLGNVGLDALVGTVPFAGDLFDAGWKANVRNVRLLRVQLKATPAARRGANRRFLVVLGLALGGLVALVAAAVYGLARLLAAL